MDDHARNLCHLLRRSAGASALRLLDGKAGAKGVYGVPRPAARRPDAEHAVLKHQRLVRFDDVDVVRLDAGIAGDLLDGNG